MHLRIALKILSQYRISLQTSVWYRVLWPGTEYVYQVPAVPNTDQLLWECHRAAKYEASVYCVHCSNRTRLLLSKSFASATHYKCVFPLPDILYQPQVYTTRIFLYQSAHLRTATHTIQSWQRCDTTCSMFGANLCLFGCVFTICLSINLKEVHNKRSLIFYTKQ